MGRLAQTEGLTEFERDILATVREFIDREIIPVASELEHRDEYPAQIVAGMKRLGLFGLTVPEAYEGLGASLLLYALVVEEITRGWMSVSGILNTHFIVAHLIARYGTAEQRDYFLPKMAAGEVRGAFSMSEPGLGSDVGGDPDQGRAGRRGVRAQRAEDVGDQRRHRQPGGGAVPDRRRSRPAAPEPDRVPDREGAGVRAQPGGARPDGAGQDPQDGLPGRRHYRADPRQTFASPPAGCSAGDRPGLLPDDGRHRGRPGQRGRPRLRGRPARLRARHRLRAAAARSGSRSPSTGDRSSWPRWPPRSRRPTR